MNKSRKSNNLKFRPITGDDRAFLRRLYASTREEELARVPWNDGDKAAFVDQQFEAQHKFYQEQFGDAEFNVIVKKKQDIGRLYLHRRMDEFRIIDIALLPEYRGKGLGARLMQDILDEAASAGKKVTIHVEHNNPAMHLYERLGFKMVEDQGVYHLMEWREDTRGKIQEDG